MSAVDAARRNSGCFGKATGDRHGVQRSAGGQARWTMRLIAEEAVKRKLVPQVGRETIRVLLSSHDLKPWREKNVVHRQLDAEYVRKMEDVLKVYERPYNQAEPVVCLDEKPVSLHSVRDPPPGASGPIGQTR